MYCSDCGAERDPDDAFCASCGTELDSDTPTDDRGPASDSGHAAELDADAPPEPDTAYLSRATSWPVAITAAVLAVIIGGFAAWATANLGISLPAFFLAAAGSAVYLRTKPTATSAAGTGLYLTALLMALTPILFYLPEAFATSDAQTAAGTGTFLGSVLGMLIYGVIFFIVAIATAGVGYLLNRRSSS